MSPSNQTITRTNFEYSSVKYWDIQPRAMPQEMLKISILDMRLEITNLRLQPYLSFLYIRTQGPVPLNHSPNGTLVSVSEWMSWNE